MVKDKLNKISAKILKSLAGVVSLPLTIFNKLIRQVHYMDPRNNTQQRIISAVVMLIIALYAIFYSKESFMILAIAIAILMAFEWLDLTRAAHNQKKWRLIGFFYILIPIYSVIKIHSYDVDILLWMFCIIWITDISAFFVGKAFGGPKLAPNISPNKTWSGLAGGILASVIIGFVGALMFRGDLAFFMILAALLSALEQVSDLFESKVKRIFGVKDSGNIIPGHGGILDRLDGVMFVAPVVLLLIMFSGKF